METLVKLFTDNPAVGLIAFTWIGACIGHVLSLYDAGFSGTKNFVEGILPGRQPAFYKRIDFIFLPIIGMILASCLVDPKTLTNAIFAGISWSGTLLALLKRNAQPKP